MAKVKGKADEDFESLDRMAHQVRRRSMRPMSPTMRQRWEVAKRGRPRKRPGEKAVPTMITVEPRLLKMIDAEARKAGMSRSQFLADAAREKLRAAG